MAKRVFQVAKEIGVKSKDIVQRCQEEGILGIENHMSTVLAGLEATILDWYGGAAAGTSDRAEAGNDDGAPTAVEPPSAAADALQTRQKASLQKATKKAKRKSTDSARTKRTRTSGRGVDDPALVAVAKHPIRDKGGAAGRPARTTSAPVATTPEKSGDGSRSAAAETPERSTMDSATTTATVPDHGMTGTDTVADDTGIAIETEPFDVATPPDDIDHSIPRHENGDSRDAAAGIDDTHMATTARIDGTSAGGGDGAVSPAQAGPMAVPNVPQRPIDVVPAGPQLDVQTPARVSGPKIVRVEQAEKVDRPRSRQRAAYAGGSGGRGAINTQSTSDGPIRDTGGASRRNVRRKSTRVGREGRTGSSGRTTALEQDRSWRQQDLLEREQRLRGAHGFIKMIRSESKKREQGQGPRARSARETGGVVKIEEPFSIKDLSAATGVKAGDIIKVLFNKGIMTNINAGIDTELAMEVMIDWGIELDVTEKKSATDLVAEQFKIRQAVDVRNRAPVVTILGHVDHGKTSLLDRIRNANVAAGEAGGITQRTSSFRVQVKAGESEKTIVFLDTPGHQAFTAMRARGARVTDIVVLVVAADDGVMPQTIESIAHARAANVPIIVALNKIDKPEATDDNLQRIYGQLAEYDLSPVLWGGSTELVKCSAVMNQGIQDLLDTIDYQAQLMELTASFGGPARGHVLEAKMVEGRGPVANVLIREGTLHVGDFIVSGRAFGRVRDMTNERGERLKEAGPSTPLELSGLSTLPDAGDAMYVVDSLRMAEEAAEQRLTFERERALSTPKVTLDTLFSRMGEADRQDLNLIVKADAQGSVETLRKSLEELSTDELNIRVIHSAVGGIMESDVLLAEASSAIVLGFNVIPVSTARELAERKNCEIRTYQVIYELLDDVKKAASGLLSPELRQEIVGHAEVRQVFKVSKVGMIAGCYVTDGTIERHASIRVTRDGIVIENDRVLEQLKRFKDDAKEVRAGQECGMKIEGYDDIKPGDVLECYKTIKIQRTL